jgi:hypothetical protein
MATREADRPLQRCWMARVQSAPLPSSYTTNRDTTSFNLGLSEKTVKMHRFLILEKIGTHNVADAIRLAVEAGLYASRGQSWPQYGLKAIWRRLPQIPSRVS